MIDMNSKFSTCVTLKHEGIRIENVNSEIIKRALAKAYKKNPTEFINMTGSSLWKLVSDEVDMEKNGLKA